jgi:S-DNA-T family DNA segregation ATPase FtsK/SpoIIIE
VRDDVLRVLRRRAAAAPPEAAATTAAPSEVSELVTLTRSIRTAASLCEVVPPFRPWLEPLGELLGPSDVAAHDAGDDPAAGAAAVGVVDDPAGQRRFALRWRRSEGNLALIGALRSGTSTALTSAVVAAGPVPHVYVIDARGDGGVADLVRLPRCGAVVGGHDSERRGRVLRLLVDEIVSRQTSADPQPAAAQIILGIDGLPGLHTALSGLGDLDDHARLVRVLADGPAVGVHTVATLERPAAVPSAMLAAFAQRWLFQLDDPADASSLGVRASLLPAAVPGRILLVGPRLEAQVAVLPIPAVRQTGADRGSGVPPAIGTLPDFVDAATMPATIGGSAASTTLVVGVDFATLEPAALELADGEHAIILGPPRSGRTTALTRAVISWRAAHGSGTVLVRAPRSASPIARWAASNPGVVVAGDDAALVAAIDHARGAGGRVLVALDDAERIDDAPGALLALIGEGSFDVTIVAAARPEPLRTMYGHWTAAVRRSRTGLVMTAGNETDGELLGEVLPRRLPIGSRPGLAWMFDAGGRRLVQVASDLARGA